MKKLALVAVLAVAGCAQHQDSNAVPWEKTTAQEIVAGTTVRMTVNLWLNKMPGIEGEQGHMLHGALYLDSRDDLPAHLDAKALIIKQGDMSQWVELEAIDVRNHSENRWEVAFSTDMPLNDAEKVDVGLQLTDSEKNYWLTQESVKVDSVY